MLSDLGQTFPLSLNISCAVKSWVSSILSAPPEMGDLKVLGLLGPQAQAGRTRIS